MLSNRAVFDIPDMPQRILSQQPFLQGHDSNSGRREIVADCQNRFVPLRSQSVHGAVSEIQSGAMAHAFPKSPEGGDSPLRLRLIEGNNLTS